MNGEEKSCKLKIILKTLRVPLNFRTVRMSNVFQVVHENLSFAFALSNLERKNKKFQVIWKQKIEA